MSNILPLFTYPSDLSYTTINDDDGSILSESDYTLKDGTLVKIFISEDEEAGKSWVITGGYSFLEYQSELEFMKAFLDLQKGKIDLYE